jgi:hypothetical protein
VLYDVGSSCRLVCGSKGIALDLGFLDLLVREVFPTFVTNGVGEPRWRRRRFFSGTLELGDQDASRPGQLGRRGRFLVFVIGADLSASEI